MSYKSNSILSNIGMIGLGLRSEFLGSLLNYENKPVDFLEVAPENWIGIGGKRLNYFKSYSEIYPIICHGLSLSIGGPKPIDINFLKKLKTFFKEFNISFYSEHLSFCSDFNGHMYDLMPMPFTEEAINFISKRIIQVQDILERSLALENVSYYTNALGDMSEIEFINAILNETGCSLLLDINNVYANSINHNYDPNDFLEQIPKEKISYFHIAGHWQKDKNLIIDTHGDDVSAPVWNLLEFAYKKFGIVPTLLERDNDVPDISILLKETDIIKKIQKNVSQSPEFLYGT